MKKQNKDKNKNKEKVDISYNLEIERKCDSKLEDSNYDFVPRINQWLSTDEQKIKVREIEDKTK